MGVRYHRLKKWPFSGITSINQIITFISIIRVTKKRRFDITEKETFRYIRKEWVEAARVRAKATEIWTIQELI